MTYARNAGLACAMLGLTLSGVVAQAQVVEREVDTKVTGPRGRTTERDIKVERGPGFVDRQVEIKRPGETIIRDTRVQAFPGGGRPGPGPMVPRYRGGPRFVENVVVAGPPVVSGFIGLPALSFMFGAPPPPPVVVAPAPGVVVPSAPAQPQPFDPFNDAMGRLKSFHGSSRRDGALTLGRLRDPRAVPALNERLEHDFDKDVRIAAAHALGEIGDERGAVALERAIITERWHKDVREAAREALARIPKPGQVPTRSSKGQPSQPSQPMDSSVGPVPPPLPTPPPTSNPPRTTVPPTPSTSTETDPGARPESVPSDQPPPPPVPVPVPVPTLEKPGSGNSAG